MTLQFQLPIETVTHYRLNDNILKDLEVIDRKTQLDTSGNCHNDTSKSLFEIIYKPTHSVDELIKTDLMSLYTTDVSFLTQLQIFIKEVRRDISVPSQGTNVPRTPSCQGTNGNTSITHEEITKAYDIIKEINDEQDFHSRYQYIEIGIFKSLNHSPHFMQMLSFYNMLSPIITLLTPIVIMILPFFLIRYQGVSLSFKAYFGTIKHLLRNHAIGKLADSFGNISWEKRVYLLITVSFYILQVYQNALSCYRFSKNMIHIHKQVFILRDYLKSTCGIIRNITDYINKHELTTFAAFSSSNERCLIKLRELLLELENITPLCVSIPKACQIGNIMRIYYSIRHDKDINHAFDYSFKLNSYLYSLAQLSTNKHLKQATFTATDHWETRNMRYPHHIGKKTIGNHFKLNHPILLTGPNASGKTTLLKSAFLNTLLSQQIGRGFYDKLIIKPYDGFHCYLDIPDTSGRDSLFQAEARRCLDVIESVSNNIDNKNNHRFFCIFDELYSGTNPTEAVAGAFALTKYLSKKKNVTFVITTHFYDFCQLCDKQRINIKNCQMEWKQSAKSTNKDDNVSFTYKMKRGVSTLRGGVRVLKQLDYPKVIVDDALLVLKDYV